MGLIENLNEIKRQKDDYITPENLKKGVTVFGVEGTIEDSIITPQEYENCLALTTKISNLNYVELEYIQSTGTQYIDTGVTVNTYMGFEADWQLTSRTTGYAMFGSRTDGSTPRFSLIVSGGPFFAFLIGLGEMWKTSADTARHKCYLKVNSGGSVASKFDNTEYSSGTNRNMFTNAPFLIFWNQFDTKASMKLYSCKLYNAAGDVTRDFIPVKRQDTNAIGLYDKITNQFYGNAGTGDFIAGPVKEG